MLCSAFMSFSGVTFPVSSHPSPTPLSSQAIGSLWDEFSQEQRGFAVAVYGGAATRPITASSHSFHMYSMALNLSAKDPVTYVISSLRDRGCLDRAAHLVRQYCSTPRHPPPPPSPAPLHLAQPCSARFCSLTRYLKGLSFVGYFPIRQRRHLCGAGELLADYVCHPQQ